MKLQVILQSLLRRETKSPKRQMASAGVWSMTMAYLSLLILPTGLSSPLMGPQEVTGFLGGSVTVQCHYGTEHKYNDKYWCHGWSKSCTITVQTAHPQHWMREGRFSIRDNPAEHNFLVNMEGLREEDAGYYMCGISAIGLDPCFVVTVLVLPGPTNFKATEISTVFRTSSEKELPHEIITTSEELLDFTLDENKMHVMAAVNPESAERTIEGGSSFTAFHAVQVAQIGFLMLALVVVHIL